MLPSLQAHLQLSAGGRRSLSAVKCTPNDKMCLAAPPPPPPPDMITRTEAEATKSYVIKVML